VSQIDGVTKLSLFTKREACTQFVKQTFSPDAQDLAWEIAAWTMTPNTSLQGRSSSRAKAATESLPTWLA
jgi:hypothetical protein